MTTSTASASARAAESRSASPISRVPASTTTTTFSPAFTPRQRVYHGVDCLLVHALILSADTRSLS